MPQHKTGATRCVPITFKNTYVAASDSHKRLFFKTALATDEAFNTALSARSKLAILDALTGAALPAYAGAALKDGGLQFDAALTVSAAKTLWLDVGADLAEVNAAAAATNENGLQAYDFENSASPFADSAGVSDGTASAFTSYQQTGQIGSKGAANLNNNTSYMTIGQVAALSGAAKFTISMVVYQSASNLLKFLFSKSHDTNFHCTTDASGVLNFYVGGDPWFVSLPSYASFLTAEAWHHLVWVYDGSLSAANRIKLYIDGAPMTLSVTTAFGTTIPNLGAINFYIGAYSEGLTYGWNGLFDQFDIFSDAKSADWITTTYNNLFQADAWSIGTAIDIFVVTFDSQGGSAVTAETIGDGDLAIEPSDPTRENYTFGGWYTEAECTTAWTFASDTVAAATTLYAKWTATATATTSSPFKNDLYRGGGAFKGKVVRGKSFR